MWLCAAEITGGSASAMTKLLFQIGVDDFDKLLCGFGVERTGIFLRVNEMGADMVLDHLRHKASHTAADAMTPTIDRFTRRLMPCPSVTCDYTIRSADLTDL